VGSGDDAAGLATLVTKSKGIRRKAPTDPKKCTTCGKLKNPDQFYGSGFRLSASCKACRVVDAPEEHRIWRMKTSQKSIETYRNSERARRLNEKRQRAGDRTARKRLAVRLITELHEAGFSNGEICRRAGMSRNTIRHWLKKETTVQEPALKRLRLVWRAWQDGIKEAQIDDAARTAASAEAVALEDDIWLYRLRNPKAQGRPGRPRRTDR
jgi:AraC-like DNA-binding protein